MNYPVHVDYEKLGMNRQVELNNISEEVNIVQEYKVGFDKALALIYDGTAEGFWLMRKIGNILKTKKIMLYELFIRINSYFIIIITTT